MTLYSSSQRIAARNLFPVLDRYADLNGAEWRAGIRLREAAFHEAGHLWAAHLLRQAIPDVALDGRRLPRIAVWDADERAKFDAAGLLAAAAMPLADTALESEGTVNEYTFDESAALDAVVGLNPCSRDADNAAATLLGDRDQAAAALRPLVDDWPCLHRLALALIDGERLGGDEVDDLMERSTHTLKPQDLKWHAANESLGDRDQ